MTDRSAKKYKKINDCQTRDILLGRARKNFEYLHCERAFFDCHDGLAAGYEFPGRDDARLAALREYRHPDDERAPAGAIIRAGWHSSGGRFIVNPRHNAETLHSSMMLPIASVKNTANESNCEARLKIK